MVIGESIQEIFFENNFIINQEKVRLSSSITHQQVTGITVNAFPNVKQTYIRQIRAMLYDWEKNGYKTAQKKHLKIRGENKFVELREVLRGRIEYLGMVRGKEDPIYRRFMQQLKNLDPSVKYEDLTIMAKRSAKIFISYAHADSQVALEIYNRLSNARHEPWIDKKIYGGEVWLDAIEKQIRNSDIFLFILSENSSNRRGVIQRELQLAFEKIQELLSDDIHLIPVKVSECDVPSALQKFQWVSYDDWEHILDSIDEALVRLDR